MPFRMPRIPVTAVVAFIVVVLATCFAPQAMAQAQTIQTPQEFFGVEIGAPGVLIKHGDILRYYRELERLSDRVRIMMVGESTDGRPFYYALVTSPENHARIDELMAMNRKLYDPRGVSEEEAADIIRDGKTFVISYHQIHSTEVGASQGAILLAHRLAAGDDAEVQRILDEVVLVHVPVHNPDGQEMVYDWLDEHRGTRYQNSEPPFLYQRYTGHDNNRDWYMFTQIETRHSIALSNYFTPQFVLHQHQMGSNGSRIFVPPFEDPWEPGIDPALIASNNVIGTYMGQYMISNGYDGVEWGKRYDAWTPARAYSHYHGGVRILTEVASARYADDLQIPFELLGEDYRRLNGSFPQPWPGGTWSFAEVVDYHYMSSVGAMLAAADLGVSLRRGMYTAQRRSVEPPAGSPYAFVFPVDQVDVPTTHRLLEVLDLADVEVERASAPFVAGGREYAAGSHVVRFAQPAGRFAKTVLERQDYPQIYLYEGGPLDPPYDVTAHTLPLLMNVAVDFVDEPFEADLVTLEAIDDPVGAVITDGVDNPGVCFTDGLPHRPSRDHFVHRRGAALGRRPDARDGVVSRRRARVARGDIRDSARAAPGVAFGSPPRSVARSFASPTSWVSKSTPPPSRSAPRSRSSASRVSRSTRGILPACRRAGFAGCSTSTASRSIRSPPKTSVMATCNATACCFCRRVVDRRARSSRVGEAIPRPSSPAASATWGCRRSATSSTRAACCSPGPAPGAFSPSTWASMPRR